MTSKKETFATLMQSFSYRYDLRSVFDDFLTMTICAFSQNPVTGKSYDEAMYMETIAKYARDELRHNFPKLLAALTIEMEDRVTSSLGNDVLGEFYEQNLYRKGAAQYFTPWPVCVFMSECLGSEQDESNERKRILDPSCGSGRTLLAGAKSFGSRHSYYGIDIDHTCVKMAAINLFLNGIFHSEVMCADALSPECFQMSYVISFLPFGIFRIADREHSRLWQMHVHAFKRKEPSPKPTLSFISNDAPKSDGAQLQLF